MVALIAQALCSLQPVTMSQPQAATVRGNFKHFLFCCLQDTSTHMHSAYTQNWRHAYFVPSSIILQETTPPPSTPYTTTTKNIF